jgi:GNAT superfamily N-acetyltransferase
MLLQVRAQGVGQALIEAVYRLADEKRAPKVYWQTHEQNYRCAAVKEACVLGIALNAY